MSKKTHISLLASLFILPTFSFAETPTPNCSETKYLAQQAFAMIKGGASFETTINAFEKSRFNAYMIKKMYDNKNIIKNISNAEKSAIKSCKSYT